MIVNDVVLTKTNYYTREYLIPVAEQKILNLQALNARNNEKKYYIKAHANSRGIFF